MKIMPYLFCTLIELSLNWSQYIDAWSVKFDHNCYHLTTKNIDLCLPRFSALRLFALAIAGFVIIFDVKTISKLSTKSAEIIVCSLEKIRYGVKHLVDKNHTIFIFIA